jgi:hypothetical protein
MAEDPVGRAAPAPADISNRSARPPELHRRPRPGITKRNPARRPAPTRQGIKRTIPPARNLRVSTRRRCRGHRRDGPRILLTLWFSAVIPWLGGAESDEVTARPRIDPLQRQRCTRPWRPDAGSTKRQEESLVASPGAWPVVSDANGGGDGSRYATQVRTSLGIIRR